MNFFPMNRSLQFVFWSIVALSLTHSLALADWKDVPESVRHDLGLPDSGEVWSTVYEAPTGQEKKSKDSHKEEQPLEVVHWQAAHLGGDRVFFQVDFDREFADNRTTLIFYIDADHDLDTGRTEEHVRGTDLMLVLSNNNLLLLSKVAAVTTRNSLYRGRAVGKSLYLIYDVPILHKEGDQILMRGKIIGEMTGQRSTSTRDKEISLPLVSQAAPELPDIPLPTRMTLGGFRYIDKLVAYEDLENRGLQQGQIHPLGVSYGRPCPLPTFHSPGTAKTDAKEKEVSAATAPARIPVLVKEEIGIPRPQGRVRFGFPLPQGRVHDASFLAVEANGTRMDAAIQGTSQWPDGSLKWAVVDLMDSFAGKEEKTYDILLANAPQVAKANAENKIALLDTSGKIGIDTGVLRCVIDKAKFRGPEQISLRKGDTWEPIASSPLGFVLTDQHGTPYTTADNAPKSISVEENTQQRVTLRIAGDYAAADGERLMSYVTRLSFHANSSRIDIAHTHINSEISHEFTDIQSLEFGLKANQALQGSSLLVYQGDGQGIGTADEGVEQREGKESALFQYTDKMSSLSLDTSSPSQIQKSDRRNPGGLLIKLPDGGINVAITDFWQRWPKGIRANAKEGLILSLLPTAPDKEFGTDLPYYLMFPLVEGYYRMKWGMSFTERFVLDFSKDTGPEQTWAEAQWPLIAVVPAQWYAETGAFVKLAVPRGDQFTLWDQYIENSLAEHWKKKDKNREYGFLNYGDWFGERGRNWGNNEYDLPHALFAQFARTGNRDFYRLATRGARHQADVDIVHAYPDPFYIGANPEHSIGHTGTWSEKVQNATWSMAYSSATSAGNGHTWADGMVDAWCLAADSPIMESALMLGEHINYAFAPTFQQLGDHERTAGWSLRAVMALYRATSDPLYLKSAATIGEIALQQQDLEKTGVWPHILPIQHAGGRENMRGNNVFLIGVLLGGLQTYHSLTHDERYATSLKAAGKWLSRNWDPETAAWPYSITIDDKPAAPIAAGLSPLIYGSMLYAGVLLDDADMIEKTKKSMEHLFQADAKDSFGKDISFKSFFTGEIMGNLQEWMDKSGNPDNSFLAAPKGE